MGRGRSETEKKGDQFVSDATSLFQLDAARIMRAEERVDAALRFLQEKKYPLGTTIVEHHWRDGSSTAVMDALAAYQNADGGFGKGLEVDITSPISNPFAARLAMHILLSLRDAPRRALVDDLAAWLRQAQNEDGDWHFAKEVYDAPLPPWFAGWTFPSLNPACCVTGLAIRLSIATPEMRERVARLFARLGTRDAARTGDFYNVLPYVEYVPVADLGEGDAWLDAIAANIIDTAEAGNYADAGHFFEHVLGGGPEIARRLPPEVMTRFGDALLDEQEDDGGWPSPYDPGWRPSQTAAAMTTLAKLRDGV